ncbi:hypothetical protein TNCV_1484501, partial [Trichonephila clavipes]
LVWCSMISICNG